jgi:hypothetical protein
MISPQLLAHIKENWLGALVVGGLALYLPIALATGVFYTNQRWIRRSEQPREYWGWMARFAAILLISLAVFAGAYLAKGA